jgi:hypothetical protein
MIVEDGSIVADANSYITVAFADDYHEKRGNTTWATMTAGEKEASIIRATDYIEHTYNQRWKGVTKSDTQSLSWPRNYVEYEESKFGYPFAGFPLYYPNDEIPKELKNALALMAWKAAGGELSEELTQGIVREKVDVLEVQYDTSSPQYTRYRAIDQMLNPLLKYGNNTLKVTRV